MQDVSKTRRCNVCRRHNDATSGLSRDICLWHIAFHPYIATHPVWRVSSLIGLASAHLRRQTYVSYISPSTHISRHITSRISLSYRSCVGATSTLNKCLSHPKEMYTHAYILYYVCVSIRYIKVSFDVSFDKSLTRTSRQTYVSTARPYQSWLWGQPLISFTRFIGAGGISENTLKTCGLRNPRENYCQCVCHERKNIKGLAPPRCPFEAGTTVVQIISTRQISSWLKCRSQLFWVIRHDLVQRIRFLRLKFSEQDFKYLHWTRSKILLWHLMICEGT